jgi:hypothetical protein
MTRRYVLVVLLVVGVLTACTSDSSEPVELPTRVVVATLPPLEASNPSPIFSVEPATLSPTESIDVALTPSAEVTAENTAEPEPLTPVPSNTITNTPTREPTATPTETTEPIAVSFLAELALELTIVLPTDRPHVTNTPIVIYQQSPENPWALQPVQPVLPVQPTTCQHLPASPFGNVVTANPAITVQIGCPIGEPPLTITFGGAYQTFEHGMMLWLGTTPSAIYVLYNNGTMARYEDTFVQGIDPDNIGQTPPANLLAPIRGFGKIWANNPTVQSGLGWATQSEQGLDVVVHEFTQGRMLYIPSQNRIYIFVTASNTWQVTNP